MTIRADQLVVIIGLGAILAFLAIGGVIVWSISRSDYSGEFDLSDVTTYEPCLQAPGQCPCLRTQNCPQRLKDFQAHPVFWLGESFQGLPLTGVDVADRGEEHGRRLREVSVNYGSCVPSGDTGCAVPLTIRISRFCETAADPRQLAEEETFEIRGAVAHSDGSWMLLRTSNVAIEFEAAGTGGPGVVANSLVRVNGGQPSSPSEPFEPPLEDCYAGVPTPSVRPGR